MIIKLEESPFMSHRLGTGMISSKAIVNAPEGLNGKGRLFAHICLDPGVETRYHIHDEDGEIYYILKGTGEYNDNGTCVSVYPGDTAIVRAGEGHSLKNVGGDVLEAIALVLYI